MTKNYNFFDNPIRKNFTPQNKIFLSISKFLFCIILPLFLTFHLTFLSQSFIFFNKTNPTSSVAFADTNNMDVAKNNFAKCKEDCLLFKTSDTSKTDFSNVYFEIPNSYFVNIISHVSSTVLKVKYSNFIGFVIAESVEIVSITPSQPVLNEITFGISPNSATQIRSTPDSTTQSNVLAVVPANTQNITYIAKINATIPQSASSDVWYFAQYTPITDPTSVYIGYIYSEKTTNLTPILANLEAEIHAPDYFKNTEQTSDDEVAISPQFRSILIALICLPVILVFIISLIKSKRLRHSQASEQKPIFNQNQTSTINNPPHSSAAVNRSNTAPQLTAQKPNNLSQPSAQTPSKSLSSNNAQNSGTNSNFGNSNFENGSNSLNRFKGKTFKRPAHNLVSSSADFEDPFSSFSLDALDDDDLL